MNHTESLKKLAEAAASHKALKSIEDPGVKLVAARVLVHPCSSPSKLFEEGATADDLLAAIGRNVVCLDDNGYLHPLALAVIQAKS